MQVSGPWKSDLSSKRVRGELRRRLQRRDLERAGSDDLLHEFGERLFEHLMGVKLIPQRVLALGPGPDSWFKKLRQQYKQARVVAASPNETQLVNRRSRWPWQRTPAVALYPEALPFTDNTFGLVLVNLLGSEPAQLHAMVKEAARVLEPGGLICASFFGPDAFAEFADAWADIDVSPHVLPFADMHDVGDMLARGGFGDIVVDAERLNLTYADPQAAIKEARALGIGNIHPLRARGLTGRGRWQRFVDTCPSIGGRTPVTIELIYVHAWKKAVSASVEVTLM
jgi:malonyl-CoA O-methyltransferase